MTIDPTELARLKEKAERFQWIDMPAPVDGSDLLALIAEVERLQSQLAQVSEVACERRVQLQTQTDLRVAAEERAGRKNVARLEAEVERLRAELASARELSEVLEWVLDRSPHVGITAPGGHVACWTAQMDAGRVKVFADGDTMIAALLALRAKKAGE